MLVSIASPLVPPSPNDRRVGIRIATFEACSGFTRVTARRIAQPPKVTFVTRLRLGQLPGRAARQLPDLSTIVRVEILLHWWLAPSGRTVNSSLAASRSTARQKYLRADEIAAVQRTGMYAGFVL